MPDSKDPVRNLPLVTEPHAVKRAAGWQIFLATFGVIAIVAVFFFGLNHQRDETAGEQTAATTPAPVAPQGGDAQQGQSQQPEQASQQQAGRQPQQQPPSTTGQSSGDDKSNAQNDRQPAGAKSGPAQRQPK